MGLGEAGCDAPNFSGTTDLYCAIALQGKRLGCWEESQECGIPTEILRAASILELLS